MEGDRDASEACDLCRERGGRAAGGGQRAVAGSAAVHSLSPAGRASVG